MKVIAILSGTYDPFTNGHLYLGAEAQGLYDEVHFVISEHPKKKPYYSLPVRLKMLTDSVAGLGIKVSSLVGNNIIEHIRQMPREHDDRVVMLRGIRNTTDYEYEQRIFRWCKRIAPERWIHYGFIMPPENINAVSSTQVKTYATHGMWYHVEENVPPPVYEHMMNDSAKMFGGVSVNHPIHMKDDQKPISFNFGKMPHYFDAAVQNGLIQYAETISGDQVRGMLDPVPVDVVLSDTFTLKEIEIDCVKPTGGRYLPCTQSLGPIIVEANKSALILAFPKAKELGLAIVIEGKHRWLDAKERGERTIKAWVGEQALPHVKVFET